MKHKKRIIAASALLAPFALAAILFLLKTETYVVSSSQFYTWDCEFPVQKPEAITLTCADGGMYIDQIDWSQWDSKGANGSGTYYVNECDPNCAEGEFLSKRVKVQLSRLDEVNHKFFLRTLVIKTFNGENLPLLKHDYLKWDVMEFGKGK